MSDDKEFGFPTVFILGSTAWEWQVWRVYVRINYPRYWFCRLRHEPWWRLLMPNFGKIVYEGRDYGKSAD